MILNTGISLLYTHGNLQISDQTPLCNTISNQDVGDTAQVLAGINDLASHRRTTRSYQTA